MDDLFEMAEDKKTCVIKHFGDKCAFLGRKKNCLIQDELGYAAKPLGCRQFPIIITRTPEGVYAGVCFLCPGILAEDSEPLAIREPEIRRLITEYNFDEFGKNGVKIAENLETDWEGYKVIETYLYSQIENEPDLHLALRKNLTALLMISSEEWKQGESFISAAKLQQKLESIQVKPLQDEAYTDMEKQFAMAVISILESINDGLKRKNTGILVSGGKLFCHNFRRNIQVEDLNEYMAKHSDSVQDIDFRRYFKHIIWRKNFLLQKPLIYGLAAFNFIYVMLNWYYYTSAFVRKAEKPEKKDMEKAFEVVEKAVFHNTPPIIAPFARLFGDSLVELSVMEW